ncbi:hypothetical protein SETIT_3G162500v2 [Setaria italica]|uniref:Uncharacterized protein n=1 Tax=Setaria italica TaxID=4555 RepID=A0A368QFU0_SETIT|nr:hypothetical protein SETIT_3G162500v2 [Setaria italica]
MCISRSGWLFEHDSCLLDAGQTAVTEGNHEDTLEVAERHGRRVLTDIQDYDYGGSNPKHDPRRKPGNGHSR